MIFDYNRGSDNFYKEGANLCLRNAKDHFKSSNKLAEIKLYGLANSHLILAVEEFIKFLLLNFKISNPTHSIEDINDFFKDHKIKHKTAIRLISVVLFIENLLDLYKEFGWEDKFPGQKDFEKIYPKFLIKYYDLIENLQNQNELKSIIKFLDNANNLKKSGFYIEFINKRWNDPQCLTKEAFLENYKLVEKIFNKLAIFEKDKSQSIEKLFKILPEYEKIIRHLN